jgi:hypothetical protein
MANQNDAKIKALLQSIEKKKEQMGTKPKPAWKTNGVIDERNINTINSIDVCIAMVSQLIGKKETYDKACEFLGINKDSSPDIDDALSDLKVRTQMVQWDIEKRKLTAMETQLKNLRSEDAKTEDALSDIAKDLV